jgi:tRNA threonylcarbamoyl adenosine modification protein YeaZ
VLVLALDTSSAAVLVAVVEVAEDSMRSRAGRHSVNARGHTELLAPSIAAALADAGARPRDLGSIVAGLGPGPFTGLRVGLVTATALGQTLEVPVYGVCSLDAIGPAVRPAGDLVVVTDARRKEVYWARYDSRGERIAGPEVARPADVPTAGARAVTGAGAALYPDELGRPRLAADYPDLVALVGRAADRIRGGAPSEHLQPLYLRRPDAVPGIPKAVSQ